MKALTIIKAWPHASPSNFSSKKKKKKKKKIIWSTLTKNDATKRARYDDI